MTKVTMSQYQGPNMTSEDRMQDANLMSTGPVSPATRTPPTPRAEQREAEGQTNVVSAAASSSPRSDKKGRGRAQS